MPIDQTYSDKLKFLIVDIMNHKEQNGVNKHSGPAVLDDVIRCADLMGKINKSQKKALRYRVYLALQSLDEQNLIQRKIEVTKDQKSDIVYLLTDKTRLKYARQFIQRSRQERS